ncbi:helix-turn-helix domain-containing protein [Pararhizobium haloflavum]|uniref:helix-turn-helix domain-containing protein n=1 Tax=Pararhizobium haloflavum TaxID=2037914 RepID=UPI001FE066A2|nr:helix-turn-helix domain-containing protein [Pararhizobium haloflavum]
MPRVFMPQVSGKRPDISTLPTGAETSPPASPERPVASGDRDSGSARLACALVQTVVDELAGFVLTHVTADRDRGSGRVLRRRDAVHRRQIAMYVAHVTLCLSLTQIGRAFGRDRTTVGHACNVVEDRRDDAGYDRFLVAVERVVAALVSEEQAHGR